MPFSIVRFCVFRPGALGDAILTLPVLASLGADGTGRRITVVGPPAFGLAVDCGLAAEHVAFDDVRLLGLFAEGGTSPVVAGCETCLVYGKEPDAVLAANLRRSGAARVIEWPAWPPAGEHVVDHLLGAVEAAGCRVANREPRLPPQAAWLAAGDSFLQEHGVRGRFAAIHPGSGGRAKRWPAERFAELARRLPVPVVWLLGPAEMEKQSAQGRPQSAVADSRQEAGGKTDRRAGLGFLGSTADCRVPTADWPSSNHGVATAIDLPLRALAGVLARCAFYVGNDSGVSHLAAAVGAPTVAIFGPTDPAVWGPRGAHVRIVARSGGLDAVSLVDVETAIRAL